MIEDTIKVRGMFRIQLMSPDGEFVVGDSGWANNTIPNAAYLNIVNLLGTGLTGSQISHMALGTGGTVSSSSTSLGGEVLKRAAITATNSGSTGLQCTATFASSASFVTAAAAISNIGLFGTSSSGTLLAGNTFASSSVATNQNINCTYLLQFT